MEHTKYKGYFEKKNDINNMRKVQYRKLIELINMDFELIRRIQILLTHNTKNYEIKNNCH